MDLFDQLSSQPHNLLPADGYAGYYGAIFSHNEAEKWLRQLDSGVAWQQDQVMVRGQLRTTRRQVAWYADQPYQYRYSGTVKTALPWIPELLQIKQHVEQQTSESYNSCLLNRYEDGNHAMGWHSDNEPEMKPRAAIASVSLGAVRRFCFRHRLSGERQELLLEHGSLLIMKEETQQYWLHQLPAMRGARELRINLTFRCFMTPVSPPG